MKLEEMKKIYICSPYKGNVVENVENAKRYSQWVCKLGYLPICVHIYLNEATGLCEEKGDREELLRLGREMVGLCDEIWVFGDRISRGMKQEIRHGRRLRIPIYKVFWINDETNKKKM